MRPDRQPGLEFPLGQIYRAALDAVEPSTAVKRFVHRSGSKLHVGRSLYSLDTYRKVFLVGVGKAGVPMAVAVEQVFGDYLDSGLIVVRHGSPASRLARTRVRFARHPVPDQAGLQAARDLVHFLDENLTGEDLLIVLVSGGGSALLPAPVPAVPFADKQLTTEILIRSGATIREINAIRKHLSQVKGGRLLEHTSHCQVISLLLSDVVGDDLASIASGLTVPDPSTFAECLAIVQSYRLQERLPSSVLDYLRAGHRQELFHGEPVNETPKPGDPRFERVDNIVVGSNFLGLQAAAKEAEALGFKTLILSSSIAGDVGQVASLYASVAREILATGNPLAPPCCVISGGEPTVVVTGDGKGGRNQHLVLSFLREVEGWEAASLLFASVGSDGMDGPTDAAGAWMTPGLARSARASGLSTTDYLNRNDSYHFFEQTGHLIKTGDTQTNVMDFHLLLIPVSYE